MTQKLTAIGHPTAFNNEQSPYRIFSYKRPLNDNVKQFKREKIETDCFKMKHIALLSYNLPHITIISYLLYFSENRFKNLERR